MDRFVSPPIDLSPAALSGEFSRADLVFYGISHRDSSFRALVFLDEPGAKPDTSPTRTEGLAGTFTIFGHGGCVGDEGHCDPTLEWDDPFDRRPPHPLEPQTKFVEITDALRAHSAKQVVVTVLPIAAAADGPKLSGDLTLTGVRLSVYGD
jgi:hypothetical protein